MTLQVLDKGDVKGELYETFLEDSSGIVQVDKHHVRLVRKYPHDKVLHHICRIKSRFLDLKPGQYEVKGIKFSLTGIRTLDLAGLIKELVDEGYRVSIAFYRAKDFLNKYGKAIHN